MSRVSDDTKLSQMSIPGTHDTMTAHASTDFLGLTGCPGGFAEFYCLTQTWKLETQLHNGIRFIDLRLVQRTSKIFDIYHGDYYLDVSLEDVFETLETFLATYPREMVMK